MFSIACIAAIAEFPFGEHPKVGLWVIIGVFVTILLLQGTGLFWRERASRHTSPWMFPVLSLCVLYLTWAMGTPGYVLIACCYTLSIIVFMILLLVGRLRKASGREK